MTLSSLYEILFVLLQNYVNIQKQNEQNRRNSNSVRTSDSRFSAVQNSRAPFH